MLVQSRPTRDKTALAIAVALLAGLLLGIVFAGSWQGKPDEQNNTPDTGNKTAAPAPAGPANATTEGTNKTKPDAATPGKPKTAGKLPLLQLTVAPEQWAKIVAHREQSLKANIIVQNEDATVPATVRLGDQEATGTIRLKGDWTDHILSNQWSLRFELAQPINGMRRFSIQHPATRHLIMEWLVMQAARRLDLLTPRCDFVHASINGAEPGVYYLEEHPSKEMLESQGRRDGPIVKFDESNMWAIWRQFIGQGIPVESARAGKITYAPAVAFSEKRLQKSDALNARLMRALEQLDTLRLATSEDESDTDRLRRLHSTHQLLGQTIDDVFDTDKVGKWLAVSTMFNGHHGQGWHQLRFYHNPMTDRLEPMVFDTGADYGQVPPELALYIGAGNQFLKSPKVVLSAFEALTEMTSEGWLEQSTTAHLDYIATVRKAFASQKDPFSGFFKLPPGFDMKTQFEAKAQAALAHRDAIRARITPAATASFAATTFSAKDANDLTLPMVEVDAWTCTGIPVRVESFVFGNGKTLPAAAVLAGLADVADSVDERVKLPDGSVLLPRNGSPLRFRFPADQRLLGLNQVQAIKRAIRQGAAATAQRLPKIDVVYRSVGPGEQQREQLGMRRQPNGAELAAGRPNAPGLVDVLATHTFLEFDMERHRLAVPAGTHAVRGDLILPDNLVLHLEPGAVAVMGAISAIGTAEKPIRFGPQAKDGDWAGLISTGTAGMNKMRFVEVSRTTSIQRGPWQTTGGVTLTGSATSVYDCTFREALGEDSLNVVGVRLDCMNCTFDGGVSDLLDGDFVTGKVVGCKFRNSDSDALDVSGSTLTVEGCNFDKIGDKALSLGEGSRVQAKNCHVQSAMIAASSKDRSNVTIQGLTVDSVERFVAVAYIKKPEFGAAQLKITGLQFKGTGDPVYLVQTGCDLEIDGRKIPTEDIDVKALYDQKILGK